MADDPSSWGAVPEEGPASWGAVPYEQPSMAADVGKSLASGVGQGVVGLPGIPGNLVSLGKNVGNWINQKLYTPEQIAHFEANRERFAKTPPTSGEVIGAAEKVVGHQFYQPKTMAGKFAETIGEFAPNIIGGPGSLATKLATRVVAPGLASEAAGQATEGTALEPWARTGAALATQGPRAVRDIRNAVAKPAINAPSLEELHDAAEAAYRNARGYGVEIKRQPVASLADDILSDLHNNGFRKLDAPSSWAKIEELKNPAGRYVTMDDIESVRRALGKANPMNGMEKEVGRRGIEAIDKYVSSLDRNVGHIAINPHFAADLASDIKEARGNWAAMKRGETIEGKLDAAHQQTGRARSGANINNATRQQISQVLRSPKLRRGFSAEELAAMRQLVMGTRFGNAARKVGKLSPEGVVSGTLGIELGHLASGNIAHGLLVPALGKVAKIFGDRSTAKQAERLSQMVRARSPLGRTLPQPSPPPPVSLSPYVGTGLLGQSSAQEHEPTRLTVSRPLIEQEQGRASGGRVNPANIDHNPSEAQKKAGNYAKDHVSLHGLDIAIENAKGKKRHGVGHDGKPWSVVMPAHYGYIKRTTGRDGDHVDVYLGPHIKSPRVYVVDQHDADSRRFDEHKAFLGFGSAAQVRACYRKAFSDGRANERLGHLTEMSVDGFKDWLAEGDTTKPLKRAAGGRAKGSTLGLDESLQGEIEDRRDEVPDFAYKPFTEYHPFHYSEAGGSPSVSENMPYWHRNELTGKIERVHPSGRTDGGSADAISDDQDEALSRSMTHYPEAPNPAAPYLQGTKDFLSGGILQTLRGQGVQLPDWLTKTSDVAQSEPFNAALGMVAPLKGAGALKAAEEAQSNTGRFTLPVYRGGRTPQDSGDWETWTGRFGEHELPVLYAHTDRDLVAREYATPEYAGSTKIHKIHIDPLKFLDARNPDGFAEWKKLQMSERLAKEAGYSGVIYPDPHDWETPTTGHEIAIWNDEHALLPEEEILQPLQRDVLARGRSGRPIQTRPLPIGNEDAVLEAGARLNEPSPSITAYHGSPHDFERFDIPQGRATGGRIIGAKSQSEVGLAKNEPGTTFRCGTCKYFSKGTCHNENPELKDRKVKPNWCCNLYDHAGMKVIA